MFLHRETAIISMLLNPHRTTYHKKKLLTRITCGNDTLTCRHFRKTKTDMSGHNLQIVVAHTLEKRELQQLVVDS